MFCIVLDWVDENTYDQITVSKIYLKNKKKIEIILESNQLYELLRFRIWSSQFMCIEWLFGFRRNKWMTFDDN